MKAEIARKMIDNLIKSNYKPSEEDRKFVEGLEFELLIGSKELHYIDADKLKEIYKKAMET